MDVQGLPILQGPVDHMRQGFRSFEQATTAQHPIQLMQNRADLEWNMKLDTVRRTHGSHMAMRLATEKAVMSRMRRLPGLKSSNIGLETLLGTDKQIEFQDYLNDPFTRPDIPKLEVYGQMEVALGQTIGVINSPDSNVVYDFTGKLAFTGGVQTVGVWNLRQASQVRALAYDIPNYPYSQYGEVVTLARCPDKVSICAGYSTGEVRIFNYVTGTLTATLRGHRSAVTSIAFDEDPSSAGTIVATGGADCDIIVWDLVSFTAMARFHEHKDAVTALAFISNGPTQKLIASTSKDALVKIWDLDTRHCVQTIVGHRSEIWSMAVINDRNEPSKVRLYTGAADELIRGYRISVNTSGDATNDEVQQVKVNVDHTQEIFKYFGCIKRSAGLDRCTSLSINSAKNVLAAQSAGKTIDLFKIRDATESKKKMKRRVKRVKTKSEQSSSGNFVDDDEAAEGGTDEVAQDDTLPASSQSDLLLVDELEVLSTIRCSSKVRSFAFNPMPSSISEDTALISLTNNTLELYKVPHGIHLGIPSKSSIIDLQGHRSDVRGLSVSTDGNVIASCSAESVKLWSSRSLATTGTCFVEGYCISTCFAPGGRYVLTGTKDGRLQIFDFASGECVFSNTEAHAGAAIWSIAVRPDGRGFMTGSADKTVKFWNFQVVANGLQAEVDRQLVLPSDVLCVRYNPVKSVNSTLLVAVGLLDNTVRIFYEDSCKLFLTLYGHKLPIMCLDISYDSTIIVTGSADKTVKIWGMDFGDCHRSLVAHDDSVTCIKFQPNTHYFFTTSKDGTMKYWDADRFEQILYFTGHKGSIWGLDIASDGSTIYTSGQDRSIRIWKRSEDLVFIEEEKERMIEAQVDQSLDNNKEGGISSSAIAGTQTVATTLTSVESVRSGEMLMEAIDLVEAELVLQEEARAIAESTKKQDGESSDGPKAKKKKVESNPLMLGLSPYQYLQRALRMIKSPDLEPALLVLPFHYVKRFISLLVKLSKTGLDIELCCKCAVFLLLTHQLQVSTTATLLPELLALKEVLRSCMNGYRELIGTNNAGLVYVQRLIETEDDEKTALVELMQKGDKIGNVLDSAKKAKNVK